MGETAKRPRGGNLRLLAIRTESFGGEEDSLASIIPPPIKTSNSVSDVDNISPFLGRPPSSSSASRSLRSTRSITREISEVLPKLYVGSAVAAQSSSLLLAHGITHVLNCCTLPNTFEDMAGGPTYLRLGLMDSLADLPRMGEAIETGVQFIHAALTAGGAVLVHCHKGISRSCTLAMAYIMWSQHKTAEDAFSAVRAKRRCCDPNLGYLVTLKDYEVKVSSDTPTDEDLPYAALPRVSRTRSSFELKGLTDLKRSGGLLTGPKSASPLRPVMGVAPGRPEPPLVGVKRAVSI